ncbi:High-affinity nickel-transporter [Planomonospora sp. ID67723]|uniref:nickel/cobalt transporter n=1 Tax=Planomonospora sp. ID67723 TaxID=2738134 RepID=UPI0018C38BFC|nr:High-affinity nickel-transporter [Planomonospora sp. ID67723]MBG0828256.1 High-affinity nickel-transporter [Planomonospora sp. ID67723]
MTGRTALRLAAASGLATLCAVLAASASQAAVTPPRAAAVSPHVVAHPLGDFTVNHHNGLKITPDRVENLAVVDSAELPTLQARSAVDGDGSGTASPRERSAYGAARCAELASAQRLTVNGTALAWRVGPSGFAYEPGRGGLETSRLTCHLSAPVTAPETIGFEDGFLPDRLGWREITAVAEGGVRLAEPPVPETSVSGRLRSYPDDLLAAPLDQRAVRLSVRTGGGPAAGDGAGGGTGTGPGTGPSGAVPPLISWGPAGDALAALDRTFTGLVGTGPPTVPLGLLAVGIAVLLGAGHALIPGHGKTVMAAYLAGRHGRPRDALAVGATVTVTHTLGVLVVGLLLSTFSFLTGEVVLAWLGLVSGLLITAVGVRLLRTAWRARRTGEAPGHGYGYFGHGHGHGRGHGRFGHGHAAHPTGRTALPEPDGGSSGGTTGRRAAAASPASSRRGLVGMGIAGGLVPSPSALVVLLGSIALGRTWFGAALVLAYGVGMAVTLTATGLLLVRLAGRLDRFATAGGGLAARASALAPVGTAAVVVLLGLGLAVRGLAGAI